MPLFEAYRAFYREPPDAARARAFLDERLARSESTIFLARDDTDGALGFAQLYPLFSSLSLQPLWLLNDLYVAPRARGRGIGTALLRRAEAHARETGAGGLSLVTAVSNRTAQRVYEAAGWMRDDAFYTYERRIDFTRSPS